MHKSSIYLTDELKASLRTLAEVTGRSEADLIRTAIEHLVGDAGVRHRIGAGDAGWSAGQTPLEAPVGIARPGLLGVGVGPGDPTLMTIHARHALATADRVIVLSTDQRSVGRAEMVVRAAVPTARIERVPFSIQPDPDARAQSLAALGRLVNAALDAGELVVVAVIGDPMQWTIFPALAAAVADRHRDRVGAVAGITAYQAVAAQRNIPLGMPGIALVVADDADTIQHRMATADTVVLYKGRADGAPLKAACAAHGRSLAVVETSAPGIPANTSASGNIAEVANGPLSYLTTAIASAPVSARVSG